MPTTHNLAELVPRRPHSFNAVPGIELLLHLHVTHKPFQDVDVRTPLMSMRPYSRNTQEGGSRACSWHSQPQTTNGLSFV